MKTGIEQITNERQRQITEKGWTSSHDATHEGGELARAAACYAETAAALAAGASLKEVADIPIDELSEGPHWPWEEEAWKPSSDPVKNLVKAGALIAAEIDRLENSKRAQS